MLEQCCTSIAALFPLVAYAIVRERAIAMPSSSSPGDNAAGPHARKKRGRDDDEDRDDNESKRAKQREYASTSAASPSAKEKKKAGGIKAALQGFQASFGISTPPVKKAPAPTRNKAGAAAGAMHPIVISRVQLPTDGIVRVHLACS